MSGVPGFQTIDDRFAEIARRMPDAIGVSADAEALTYAELDRAASRLAHRLRALGVEREQPVAVCLERSIDLIVALLGVLKAGGIYVVLDPSYPPARLSFMLEDTGARILLTRDRYREIFSGAPATITLDADRNLLEKEPELPPRNISASDDIATLIYTSGSTGAPKGVCLTHFGWVDLLVYSGFYEVGPGDVVSHTANPSFDASALEIFGALLNGARLEIISANILLAPDSFAKFIADRRVTSLFLATGLFNQLGRLIPGAFSGVRNLIFGGDVADPSSVRAVLEMSRPGLLRNAYGPTECTCVGLAYVVEEVADASAPLPIGNPPQGGEVYLFDADMRPVPEGTMGEIYLGGKRLARGYYRRPELTVERFVEHPSMPGTRLYKTGDLGRRLPSGQYDFAGRIDQQVKVRGYRVELQEIEAVLATHPDAREAAVVARRDRSGEKRLIAYIAANSIEAPPSEVELRAYLSAKLPAFMVPQAFVVLERLPLTTNGKVDRAALPEPTQERGAQILPRTETEIALARLYGEILGVSQVGVEESFFDLGGHSLLAARLLSQIRRTLHRDLTARDIFANPKLGSLAELVEQRPLLHSVADEAILRQAGAADIPLTFSQGRVLFIEELGPGNIAYNTGALIRLRGHLDISALERALEEIIRRHESLRTTIEAKDGEPRAKIHAPWPVKLRLIESPGLDEAARVLEARRHGREEAGIPFDPTKLPLLRWRLVRFAEDDHVLVNIEHHLVHDGWSFNVLMSELFTVYRAYVFGQPSPLPEPAIQLSDFARWQRRLMESAEGKAQLEYYRSRLVAAPVLEMPTSRQRPPRQTFVGRAPRMLIPAELMNALRGTAKHEGATVYATMLAAFEILIHRYTSQTDLVLGTGIANRRAPESEGLIGMLVNNVVLRTDLSGNPTVREVIRRVRETVLGAFENQDVPFERVVDAVRPVRDQSRNPLMQVMFSFHDAPLPRVEIPGLEVSFDLPVENGTAKMDLNVIGVPAKAAGMNVSDAGAMTLVFEHNSDIFDLSLIQQMMGAYRVVLEQLSGALDTPISEVEILTEAEKNYLLYELNDTQVEYPRDKNVVELFEEQVARVPDNIALIYEDRTINYRDLNARAERIAGRLQALGALPGTRVAFFAARRPDTIATVLAILKVGAAYVPLDPTYPPERLRFMIKETAPVALCVESSLPAHFSNIDIPSLRIDRDDSSDPNGEVPRFRPVSISPQDSAYIMFTSGSTGEPRGVDIPHRGIVRLLFGTNYVRLGEKETLLHLSPISFDASTFEVWGALLHGARCVLFPAGTPSPRVIGDLVQKHQVSTLWLTASLFNAVIDDHPEALRGVRQLLAGGEALSVSHVARALEKLPEIQLINGYGPTETTTFACCYPVPRPYAGGESVPIGKPISSSTAYILDAQRKLLPLGIPGELYLGGDGLARGYFNRPELTAEKFVPGPVSERVYKTGDRVRYRADGNIEFLGRTDHQVKIRGFRVELGEIEHLMERFPGVRNAAAVVQQDSRGEKRLVAFVAPVEGMPVSDAALTAFLRDSLPEHMLPSAITVLDQLPLNPVGKVDRAALSAKTADSPPSPSKDAYQQPIDPSEMIMAEIWERLLDKRPIGRHDDFFELGGHSLLAARLVDEMERALGTRLPLAAVLGEATIAQMAKKLRERTKDLPLITPIQTEGSKPPLFFLHGDFNGGGFYATRVAREIGPDQPFYVIHPFGVHGEEIPRSVEKMVDIYLREIKALRPHGPYRIGGYCTGGLVAYEIARRLEEQGEAIDRLVLLDAVPRNTDLGPLYSALGSVSEKVLSEVHQRVRKPLLARQWLKLRLRESEEKPLLERIKFFRNIVKRDAKRIDPDAPKLDAQWRAFELIGIYRRILAAHVPRKYRGPLTIIWPKDDPMSQRKNSTAGWSRVAPAVQVRTIPGDHFTAVTKYWKELAEQLRAALA
jgi:amino acid adenylation domain-containing protein